MALMLYARKPPSKLKELCFIDEFDCEIYKFFFVSIALRWLR